MYCFGKWGGGSRYYTGALLIWPLFNSSPFSPPSTPTIPISKHFINTHGINLYYHVYIKTTCSFMAILYNEQEISSLIMSG